MPRQRFHGGLRLPGAKLPPDQPLRSCPLAERLLVPLLQHSGDACEPAVAVGDRVRRGDPLGIARSPLAAPVHAPAAGTVLAIEPRPFPHPSGLEGPCVLLQTDPADAAETRMAPLDWSHADVAALRQRIHMAGIVGLGGAAFPTAAKIAVPRRVLVINGAECEPYISCDDQLLRARAAEVVAGARVLARVVAAEQVLVAVEDSMPEAHAALAAALGDATDLTLATVPTVYPAGGERQLIQVLTGLEVPRGGLPRDIGVVVQNVATAAAVWRAVACGEPLTRRIVTVTGRGVRQPGNFEVAIGTPVAALVAAAGGYTDDAARLLIGGPLMGLALPDDGFPIVKGSNCVLVLGHADLREPAPELPCIRCGECARVCPAQLLPQQLLAFGNAGQWQRATDHGLFDCIECGCCDLACPSHIPLVERFRSAKSAVRARDLEAAHAAAARQRFEARQRRLEQEAAERAERQAARRAGAAAEGAAAQERARALRDGEP
jgi:Na+-translocating ferredoxin:NAD+ oxidoreductase subunit C